MSEEKSLDYQLIEASSKQDLELVKQLIAQGAEASYVYKEDGGWGAYEQYTALHYAITGLKDDPSEEDKETWREIILLLLKHGADPNTTKDSYNWKGSGSKDSAFELLVEYTKTPDPDLLTAFIGKGLNPNTCRTQNIHSMRTDGFIKTYLLHDMVRKGFVDCAIALLNADADVEARASESINNERGYRKEKSETPMHVAVSSNRVDMCLLLLAKGANINALGNHLDSHCNRDIVLKNEELCGDNPRDDAYEDPWTHTPVCCTPLHKAIVGRKKNRIEMISILLACNADINVPYKQRIVDNYDLLYSYSRSWEDDGSDEESKDKTNSISTSDLFASHKKTRMASDTTDSEEVTSSDEEDGTKDIRNASDLVLTTYIEHALLGKLDVTSIVKSLSVETQGKILQTLEKIKELGWSFDNCNFPLMYEALKSP